MRGEREDGSEIYLVKMRGADGMKVDMRNAKTEKEGRKEKE